VQRQKTQATVWGHLRLPKDVSVFKEVPNTRILLDILPYTVSDPAHPDRDDEFGACSAWAVSGIKGRINCIEA